MSVSDRSENRSRMCTRLYWRHAEGNKELQKDKTPTGNKGSVVTNKDLIDKKQSKKKNEKLCFEFDFNKLEYDCNVKDCELCGQSETVNVSKTENIVDQEVLERVNKVEGNSDKELDKNIEWDLAKVCRDMVDFNLNSSSTMELEVHEHGIHLDKDEKMKVDENLKVSFHNYDSVVAKTRTANETKEDTISALDNLISLLEEPSRKEKPSRIKSLWDQFDQTVKNNLLKCDSLEKTNPGSESLDIKNNCNADPAPEPPNKIASRKNRSRHFNITFNNNPSFLNNMQMLMVTEEKMADEKKRMEIESKLTESERTHVKDQSSIRDQFDVLRQTREPSVEMTINESHDAGGDIHMAVSVTDIRESITDGNIL